MGNEMTVYDANQDVAVYRPPEVVLAEAQKAAKALADVVSRKKKPVVMNGEQYLEFEDWQTVGRFYGVTAKAVSTQFIEYGSVQGFEARAVAVRADGMELSGADAMCLNDEPNWKNKPLFQLRSMAQTRACAKALRNVLAWVVVLAGYRPTPAEEMQGGVAEKPALKEPQKKDKQDATAETVTITITDITHKDGEKAGKPWRAYYLHDENGGKYGTFSETMAEIATGIMTAEKKALITYTVGKFGNNLSTIEEAA